MSKLKKIYKQIDKLDDGRVSNAQRLSKLFEECGEFAQSINKTIGMKSTNQSREDVECEILEEGADVVQNVFSILADFGFSLKDLEREIERKNKVWEKKLKLNDKNKKHGK